MEDKEIIIVVEGGVIQDIQFPENCPYTIKVRDYDVECGGDNMIEDEQGFNCLESIWENI